MFAWSPKLMIGLPLCLILALVAPKVTAVPLGQFTPPTNITVQMYALNPDGSLPPPDRRVLCASGNMDFGCTAFVGDTNHPYPYTDNPVTVFIEKDYLLDVVPRELGAYYHPTALRAQAIAARSYAYYKIANTLPIDNSASGNQAFIP